MHVCNFAKTAKFLINEGDLKEAAFLLHQAIEQTYSTFLLVLTNYSPASQNLKFLRRLAEDQKLEMANMWLKEQTRFKAWFNIINQAYVKARYFPHFETTEVHSTGS